MQRITVTISRTGEISYEVNGVKGASCKDLTKAIDNLGTVKESKKTGEYYEGGPNIHLQQGI